MQPRIDPRREVPMPSTLTGAYRVADGDVRLRIVVGNGQFGWSTVLLGSQRIAEGRHVDALLGSGPELRGRVLLVTTDVRDVQPGTDHVSVAYRFTGGRQPKMWTLDEQLEEGGSFQRQAVFTFTD
jgi:hypothetical protein